MPKPDPREFRDDIARVARDREAGVLVEQITKDFEIHRRRCGWQASHSVAGPGLWISELRVDRDPFRCTGPRHRRRVKKLHATAVGAPLRRRRARPSVRAAINGPRRDNREEDRCPAWCASRSS